MTPDRKNYRWLPNEFTDFFYTDYMPKANATAPAINVKENEKAYIVELAAPGLCKDDFSVHINDEGNLSIKMENKKEQNDEARTTRYLRHEFAYSNYEQTLILPDDVNKDKISAKVEYGVLTVILPKIEETKTRVARQITIG